MQAPGGMPPGEQQQHLSAVCRQAGQARAAHPAASAQVPVSLLEPVVKAF